MHHAPQSAHDPSAMPDSSLGADGPPPSRASWDDLQQQLQRVQHAVNACSRELTGFESERETARMERAFLQEQGRTLREDREALGIDRASLGERSGELDALQGRLDQRGAELEERAERADEIDEELSRREAVLQERRGKLEAHRKEFDERARRTIAELRDREQRHQAELEEKRKEIDRAHERRAEQAREELERKQAEFGERERELEERHQTRSTELEACEERLRGDLDLEREKLHQGIEQEARRQSDRERERNAELDQSAAELDQSAAELEKRGAACERREAELMADRERTDQRRRRIGRYKKAIHQRAGSLRRRYDHLEAVRSAALEVVGQRGALAEVRRLLADAEHRMIRRWAVGRGMSGVVGVVLCAAVLLVISYAVADRLATRRWVVSAAVQHHNDPDAAAEGWAAAQKERMLSDAVLRETAVLLREAGYAGPAQPPYLRNRIEDHLRVASPRAGLLHAELQATGDPETLRTLFAALTRAYAAETSTAQSGPRGLTARVTHEAALDDQPLADNHLTVTAEVFGGSAAAAVLLFFLARLYLLYTARRITGTIGGDDPEENRRWRHYESELHRPASPVEPQSPEPV